MVPIKLRENYKKRSVRFLGLFEHNGWKIKVYGISYDSEKPRDSLVEAAKKAAVGKLPQITEDIYGIGFLGVHDGRGANLVFLDWWGYENELFHHTFLSSKEHPENLEENTPDGPAACVWDLIVIGFERQAWVDYVLSNGNGPDIEGYLACTINEYV
ncbi:MAG: isochorismatase [Brevibacillus sp.]|nr:isochorismatase [Brevibacillus sp.]